MNRQQWQTLCEAELGKPYIWGAEGPESYDCSGFVQWALRRLELDPPGDQTADGLYRHFKRNGKPVAAADSEVGDLVFFGTDEAVTHVALAWGGEKMLEAGGGGRKTTTVDIARQQNAQVRIEPMARRKDLVAVLRPDALDWFGHGAPAALESPSSYGHYVGAPPHLAWLEGGRDMRLTKPFTYVQQNKREWPVPAEAVVNGASIPRVFWSLIGGPFEGEYRNASIVHDHYCDVKTQSWQDTHRVFYEAMRCSGVGAVQAKIMFYAVYRFGPRWTLASTVSLESFRNAGPEHTVALPLPADAFDEESFKADADIIASDNLDLSTVEALAESRRGIGLAVEPALRTMRIESAGRLGPPESRTSSPLPGRLPTPASVPNAALRGRSPLRFVETARLTGAPVELRAMMEGPKGTSLDLSNLPAGIVANNTLIDHSAASAQSRSGLSLALTFANWSALAQVGPEADEDELFAAYKSNLVQLGFNVPQSAFARSKFKKTGLAVHKAIIPFLTAALGGAAVGPVLLALLDNLQKMDSEQPWITLFDRQTRIHQTREMHFGAVASDAVETRMRHVAARLFFVDRETNVLFFRINEMSAEFESVTTTMGIDNGLLSVIEPALRERLGLDVLSVIKSAEIVRPPAR